MSEFDMKQYVLDKFKDYPEYFIHEEFLVNLDGWQFVISNYSNMGMAACLSLTGLEMLQNDTEEAIKDLIDTRFSNTLKTLKEHQAATA